MAKIYLDESLDENYPPKEFCRKSCKTGAFSDLVQFEKENEFWITERAKSSSHGLYWRKMSFKRIMLGCDMCQESLKHRIKKEKSRLEEEIRRYISKMAGSKNLNPNSL